MIPLPFILPVVSIRCHTDSDVRKTREVSCGRIKEDKKMAHKRSEVPELEKMLQYGRKKFVRYDEGAKIYSMGLHSFQNLAKDAGAVYKIK